jgi:hypothetical protein
MPKPGQTNFYFLLVALLIFLVAIPLADDLELTSAPIVRAAVFSCLLVIGIWSLRGGGRFFTIGMTFVVAGVLLSVFAANSTAVILQYGSVLSLIGFLLVAIAYTLRQVAVGNDINADRLVGAVCVYLLLGVIWALLYTLVDLVSPGSFSGFRPVEDLGWDSEWLYLSFVTMTTLGYGDVLPVSATARGLAYMQAVVGQFYIAILVAGLVSAYISGRRDSS